MAVALPAAATGAPASAPTPARVAANTATYQDSVGENPAAPDITTIVVSNNDAASISLRLNVPNRPTLTQDMLVIVWVDSDNNPATTASSAMRPRRVPWSRPRRRSRTS